MKNDVSLIASRLFTVFAMAVTADASAFGAEITARARARVASTSGSQVYRVEEHTAKLLPRETAIVVCDMWDVHWCQGATQRVAELAPVMNEVIAAARELGVLIIHAPSSTMTFYESTPQRARARSAPAAVPPSPITPWR